MHSFCRYCLILLVWIPFVPSQAQQLDSADFFTQKNIFRVHYVDKINQLLLIRTHYEKGQSQYLGKRWCFSFEWKIIDNKASFCSGLIILRIDPKKPKVEYFGNTMIFTEDGKLESVVQKNQIFKVFYTKNKISHWVDQKKRRYNFIFKNNLVAEVTYDSKKIRYEYKNEMLNKVSGPLGEALYTYSSINGNRITRLTSSDTRLLTLDWAGPLFKKLNDHFNCQYTPDIQSTSPSSFLVECPEQKHKNFKVTRKNGVLKIPLAQKPTEVEKKNPKVNMKAFPKKVFLKPIEKAGKQKKSP